MSLCLVSWRKVKRLNRQLDEEFVSAAASHNGRSWLCVRYDGTTAWVDVRTGEQEPGDGSSTARLLMEREPRYEGQSEWLAELDRRHAESTKPQ